jgi:hypothetical protein
LVNNIINKIYIAKWCFWSPGEDGTEAPLLPFVSPMLKRRLSQLSRMVLYAVHYVSQGRQQVKISFSSEYGEITQQLKISEEILESEKISPAKFSNSVFNAPVAMTTIAEKNMQGYSAICSGKDSFYYGLSECLAALRCGADKERIFVHGDELVPLPYQALTGGANTPFVLAFFLSSVPSENCLEVPDNFSCSGLNFAKDFLHI